MQNDRRKRNDELIAVISENLKKIISLSVEAVEINKTLESFNDQARGDSLPCIQDLVADISVSYIQARLILEVGVERSAQRLEEIKQRERQQESGTNKD